MALRIQQGQFMVHGSWSARAKGLVHGSWFMDCAPEVLPVHGSWFMVCAPVRGSWFMVHACERLPLHCD